MKSLNTFSLVLLYHLLLPELAFSDSDTKRRALVLSMENAGFRNIEVGECRVRFEYGRVPACEDGKPRFFEQDFRLQNVRWHTASEVFADGTQTTTNYFVTFEPAHWYFQELASLPSVNAQIKREFPKSKWPAELGPENDEILELIYSHIPKSSPYNWRFFHSCWGESPGIENGLMLIFESERDARLVSDALVTYANSKNCPTDQNLD